MSCNKPKDPHSMKHIMCMVSKLKDLFNAGKVLVVWCTHICCTHLLLVFSVIPLFSAIPLFKGHFTLQVSFRSTLKVSSRVIPLTECGVFYYIPQNTSCKYIIPECLSATKQSLVTRTQTT